MTPRARKTLIFAAKGLVAGGLLWYVLRKVTWRDSVVVIDGQERFVRGFGSTLASADPLLLAAAFACAVAPVLIMSVRWWYLLRVQRIRMPLWEAVRLTFLGTFFNYVVPGTVSGDLVKAWYAARHTPRKAAVLVSVIVDRVIGLLAFALLPAATMCGMVLFGGGWSGQLVTPAVVVAVVLVGGTAGLAVLLSPPLRAALRLDTLLRRGPLKRRLQMVRRAADLYRRRLPALARALAMTFCGQLVFICSIVLAAVSLDAGVPWYRFFLFVPLIYIIAAVPVSPGGLGVVEFFFVQFFFVGPGGPTREKVLAVALVARLMPMIWSLPGLVVAVRGPALPDARRMQAELADEPART